MPGSWEERGPQVLVAILTREFVSAQWASGLRELQLPPGTPPPHFIAGRPFDDARNHACELALKEGIPSVFFLDDDVIPPSDAYFRLAAHQKEIVSGLYYRRHGPTPVVPCMQVNGQWVTAYTIPALLEVDLVGAGCLLLQTSILARLKKPWFEWRISREDLPPNQRMSEDFQFCYEARRAGLKIHVDTSIQCLHVGMGKARAEVAGGTFTPLGWGPDA